MKRTEINRCLVRTAAIGGLAFAISPALAHDDDGTGRVYSTTLSGYNEVHFNGGTLGTSVATLRSGISTGASGSFKIEIDENRDVIDYVLSYDGLEGSVTQAHIHFGLENNVGGIVVWLCQTAGTPAPAAVTAATPLCPAHGTVSGTIRPAQVLAQTAQGIGAGDFDKVVNAIRAGAAYANVHTSLYAPGEIRGQIRKGGGHTH